MKAAKGPTAGEKGVEPGIKIKLPGVSAVIHLSGFLCKKLGISDPLLAKNLVKKVKEELILLQGERLGTTRRITLSLGGTVVAILTLDACGQEPRIVLNVPFFTDKER